MHDLIIRSLQGLTEPGEEQKLRAWRDASPENEEEYRSIARVWSLTGASATSVLAGAPPPDAKALIRQAEGELLGDAAVLPGEVAGPDPDRGAIPAGPRPTPWFHQALKVAALAILFIPVGLGLAWIVGERAEDDRVAVPSEITTGAGEMTTVSLVDGTSVRLGPRSRLRLSQEEQNQIVELEGRAFFGVPSDPTRTFIVRTKYGEAAVLGTRFEVRSEDEEFRVLVVEGSVQVSAGDVAADLQEGEMSRSRMGEGPSTSRVSDVYSYLDWMGNALVFQSTPLERALHEVERRYGLPIDLHQADLTQLTVTATFTDRPVGEVLFVLCEIIGAECVVEEGRVRIGVESQTVGGSSS